MENDYNYWYYTLSAIPQTLAAIIALVASFVVFKLNFLSEKIQKNRNDLVRFILLLASYRQKEIHDIENLSDLQFADLYKEALTNIKEEEENLGLDPGIYERVRDEMGRIIIEEWRSRFPARNGRIVGYLNMKKDMLIHLLYAKKLSLHYLGLSLLLITLTILASLFALPNYNIFNSAHSVVDIIFFGAFFSIVFTAWSVWRIANIDT